MIQPNAGKLYYLRLLLCYIPGLTSFDHLLTVNGEHCLTFKEAAEKHGFLENNQEWDMCLTDATIVKTGGQLQELFVILLLFCQPTNPLTLWLNHKAGLCEDLLYKKRLQENNPSIELSEEIEALALYHMDLLLQESGKTLSQFSGMPQYIQPSESSYDLQSHDDLQLTPECLQSYVAIRRNKATLEQKTIIDAILTIPKL